MLGRLPSDKASAEFAPLFSEGFHRLTVADLKQRCVDAFPQSTTREHLMVNFQKVLLVLEAQRIRCEIWIDGSFATFKPNPRDIDFTIRYMSCELTVMQDKIITWIREDTSKWTHPCHAFYFSNCPPGHVRHERDVRTFHYWQKWWGTARDGNTRKGIIVIDVQ